MTKTGAGPKQFLAEMRHSAEWMSRLALLAAANLASQRLFPNYPQSLSNVWPVSGLGVSRGAASCQSELLAAGFPQTPPLFLPEKSAANSGAVHSGVKARCWNVGRYGRSLHLWRDTRPRRAGRMWEQVRKKFTPDSPTYRLVISWPRGKAAPYATRAVAPCRQIAQHGEKHMCS